MISTISPFFNPIASLGKSALSLLSGLGRWGFFAFRTVGGLIRPPYKVFPSVKQIRIIGFDSLSIILLTGFFTGMVLGLQGYHTLKMLGQERFLGFGVTLTLFSELGPVLSALLLTGRAGSAMSAEIGVMRISEQIDALECMAIDTYKYLVSPKLLGGLISLPILTMLFCLMGLFGGYVAGVLILGINPGSYYQGVVAAATGSYPLMKMCIIKSIFFAFFMVSICSYKGYFVHRQKSRGALGVSAATTQAVVASSVIILLWNYLLANVIIS